MFFFLNQIRATELLLHDIDIGNAIVDYINKNSIANIVIGASARNTFLKYLISSLI